MSSSGSGCSSMEEERAPHTLIVQVWAVTAHQRCSLQPTPLTMTDTSHSPLSTGPSSARYRIHTSVYCSAPLSGQASGALSGSEHGEG